jgi:cytochrome b
LTTANPWDLTIRIFHWSLAIAFLANALITDDDSALHEWLGYAVLGLILGRIIWGFTGPVRVRFSSFPPSFKGALEHFREILSGKSDAQPHFSHNPLGALMVYNFLASLTLVGLTGYLMTTAGFKDSDWLEETHELLSNWVLFSVFLHVVGVVLESRRLGVNLIKTMIGGTNDNDDDAKI